MSGANFNITTNRAANEDGSVAAGSGGGGGSVSVIEVKTDDIPSAVEFLSTAGSPADTGLEITFVANEDEYVEINLNGSATWTQGDNALVNVLLYTQLDGGADNLILQTQVGDGAGTAEHIVNNSINTTKLIGPLSAGQHTLKIRGEATGTGTRAWQLNDSAFLELKRFKSFVSGSGTIVTSSTIGSDFTPSVASTFEDTGLEATINTLENEQVMLSFNGYLELLSTNSTAWQVQFLVDGVSFGQWYTLDSGTDNNQREAISINRLTNPLTEGEHTIKVQMRYISPGANFNLTFEQAKFDVIQFRAPKSENTDWATFTPTGSWVSNVSYTGKYKLVGDTMFLRAAVTCSGAPNATTLSIDLPAGFTIDTAKLSLGASEDNILGTCYTLNQSIAAVGGVVRYSSTTAVSPMYNVPAGVQTNLALITNSAPFSFSTGDSVNIDIMIPVIQA